ncbi:MAG TPA: hypothetical protein DCE78_06000, partial [Bacteroidetes bacterium]|nr:hypothetical protein [Bacteroidota bacterium]
MNRFIFRILQIIAILVLIFSSSGLTAKSTHNTVGVLNHESLLLNDSPTNSSFNSSYTFTSQDKFSCSDNIPESKEKFAALVDELSPVWNAISTRDEHTLLDFLSSESPFVRETAWRGLANMSVNDINRLFELAMDESLDIKWFTLSNQTLNAAHLRRLENLISSENPDVKS